MRHPQEPIPMDMSTYSTRRKELIEKTKRSMENFSAEERRWRARAPLFTMWGYTFRRRFDPTVCLSWQEEQNKNIDPVYFEDWIVSPVRLDVLNYMYSIIHHLLQARLGVLDATRNADNKQVYIKSVAIDSPELAIAEYLRSVHDPTNHCVPILAVHKPAGLTETERHKLPPNFDVQEYIDEAYIVMPLLRAIDDPPFETVSDIVDLVNQLLEVGITLSWHPPLLG
jgi:hypothetical protein